MKSLTGICTEGDITRRPVCIPLAPAGATHVSKHKTTQPEAKTVQETLGDVQPTYARRSAASSL